MDSLQVETTTDLVPHPQLSQAEVIRSVLRPGVMKPYLEAALEQSAARKSPARFADCHILDMKYEPGDYCTLLYQLGEQMVAGHIQWKESGAGLAEAASTIPHLGMQVFPFPADPWLPILAEAMNPSAVIAALVQALPEFQPVRMRILRLRLTPQRYRPGKRATLRLDVNLRDAKTGEIAARTYYGKIYHHPEKAKSVYEEMQLLSQSAAARPGKMVLARPVAYLADLSMVLQEPVAGTPLEELFGQREGNAKPGDPRACSGMKLAAAALAELHSGGLSTERLRPIAAELARFQKRSKAVAEVDMDLGGHMGELAAALPAWLERMPEWGAEVSLIHGDCKPSQFLIGAEHAALLDFDHCGMADPANDVGTFLATIRQLAIRQSLKNSRRAPAARSERLLDLEKNFLDEYCQAAGRGDGFRLRAAWYEAVGLLRKALRGFGRSPFSSLPGALVAEAWVCLADLPPARGIPKREL